MTEALPGTNEAITAAQSRAAAQALLQGVAHDLKGQLFTLTGYLDLLRLEAGEALGGAAVYVDRMAATATHMQDIVNALLTPDGGHGRPAESEGA